jgi:hypothetical protein
MLHTAPPHRGTVRDVELFEDPALTRPADPSTYEWVDGHPHGSLMTTSLALREFVDLVWGRVERALTPVVRWLARHLA